MTSTKVFSSFLVLFSMLSMPQAQAQTPCENGMAGDYPCQNIKMLAHVTPSELMAEPDQGVYLNDIWGWTDPDTGKEYALVGMANGTSFVDITDPINPVVLGMLPEHHLANSSQANSGMRSSGARSIWRDIKVYQNHAFIVSEDAGHGMQVFDLTDLRNVVSPPVEFSEAGHYDGISNAHNLVINEETGFAYAVGVNGGGTCGQGGLHIIDIKDPTNPVYEACFDEEGYTHDAQCVIYNGPDTDYQGREICFNANEDELTFVDVNDKGDMKVISSVTYEKVNYAHQGWLTEDHKYFISNDETDEYHGDTGHTKTFIWDVQDLDQPELIGIYEHTTTAIDHNLYTLGDRVYQSNYTSGLRILDTSDIERAELRELGFFDTYPQGESPTFWGNWSNYPYFESGTIAVSDITNGLFLLEVDFNSAYLVHHPKNAEACEGSSAYITVEVAGDNLNYQWQYDQGSGFVDIEDTENFGQINERSLQIIYSRPEYAEYEFRCVITYDETVITSREATVNVIPGPVVDFDMTINKNKVNFINNTSYGDSYTWDFGDGSSISELNSPTHTYPSVSSNYTVELTATNECLSNSIEKDLNLIINSSTSRLESEMVIFPNPGQGYVRIKNLKSKARFEVYNTSGKTLIAGKLSRDENQVFVGNLESGIYVMEIISEQGHRNSQKLVIH